MRKSHSIALIVLAFIVGFLYGLPVVYAAPPIPAPSIVAPAPVVQAMQAAREVPDVPTDHPVIGPIERLMRQYNRKLDKQTRQEITFAILDSAAEHNLDPLLVASVIAAESAFRPRAKSHCGAKGLMQLMPIHGWRCPDRYDIRQNIDTGCWYLRLCLDRWGGDVTLALAGYNAGRNSAARALRTKPDVRAYAARVQRTWRGMKSREG